MRRILKRFTGLFCVLALCLSMLPVSALAAEDAPSNQPTTLLSDDNVAKIEENEYPTLDEAVKQRRTVQPSNFWPMPRPRDGI